MSPSITPSHEVIILGTGNATVTRCYNTCFILRNPQGHMLLVDAGGGNGILRQLQDADVRWEDIHDLYVTHAHTDHILGVVWLLRMALQYRQPTPFRVYSHRKVLDILTYLCQQLLPAKQSSGLGSAVEFHEVVDGSTFIVDDMHFDCFDIHSTKERQFGFSATLSSGIRLVCLGDEPYSEENEHYVRGADWLMSEAFCLYADRDRFQPYKKHHSTVIDAARLAESLQVPHLILYHTEDKTLDTRRERYTAEATSVYHGHVIVPDDLERIPLDGAQSSQ